MSDSGCLSSSVDWVDMVYCKGWWDGCGGEGIYGCVDEDDICGWSSDEGYNGLCYGEWWGCVLVWWGLIGVLCCLLLISTSHLVFIPLVVMMGVLFHGLRVVKAMEICM